MKAVAVFPGNQNSAHLVEISKPSVEDVADGRGVPVKVVRVGIDGTDTEIDQGLYGEAPEGGG